MNKAKALFSRRLLSSCRMTEISKEIRESKDGSRMGPGNRGQSLGTMGICFRKDAWEASPKGLPWSHAPNEMWDEDICSKTIPGRRNRHLRTQGPVCGTIKRLGQLELRERDREAGEFRGPDSLRTGSHYRTLSGTPSEAGEKPGEV